MRWAKQYKRRRSTRQVLLKKKERRDKMARLNALKQEDDSLRTSKVSIPEEKFFVLCNGAKLRDIKELAVSMEHLDEKEFALHVNEEKNDFANWVRDVFEEPKLASEMEQASSMKDTHIALLKHMAFERR